MTTQPHVTRWGREFDTDKPPVNVEVEIWHAEHGMIWAVWDGKRWRTTDGDPLRVVVTHWYSK